jgi:hypothetical protein
MSITLEDALAEYLSRKSDPNVPRHVMAMRYYIRDLIWMATEYVMRESGGVTNYTELVRQCFQWAAMKPTHVCFVSFNYDPLLEFACNRHFRMEPWFIESYTQNETASVLKPHGSVLWSWAHPAYWDGNDPVSAGSASAIFAGEPDGKPQTKIYAASVPQDSVNPNLNRQIPAIPALALPITNKAALVWPPDQDRFFREVIPPGSFGRVLAIGWRAAEDHFLPLLSRLIPGTPKSRLMVVAGGRQDVADNDAKETEQRIMSVIGGSPPTTILLTGGFGSIFQTHLPQFLAE